MFADTLLAMNSHRFGPYFCQPVIAGLEPDGTPYLCGMDSIGAMETAKDFMVAGTATESLLGVCESLWRPDLVRRAGGREGEAVVAELRLTGRRFGGMDVGRRIMLQGVCRLLAKTMHFAQVVGLGAVEAWPWEPETLLWGACNSLGKQGMVHDARLVAGVLVLRYGVLTD